MSTWFSILSRRKPFPKSESSLDSTTSGSSQLARVLDTFDLTALGVGSTLGVGVYVLAGHVAKDSAGPAVILSFLIAAVASVFAGLCYAEFGARVPKAGSAYIYSYVCVGEFVAFIIGWNLILEYVIGSASVAKGLSVYLDTLFNNSMRSSFLEVAPIDSNFLSEYFDFFAFTVSIILGGALAFGLKESSLTNTIFTLINLFVVIFVIIAGSFKADPKNWTIDKNSVPPEYNAGKGGFLPFGISGVIKGAATCFYGFVGFDCIATTGEEVKNPKKAIPLAIILSLFIIFLSYFGTSAVVTLMLPYYLQDADAPVPHAFEVLGWTWAKWVVSIGGLFGLCASLYGSMFPLPRIIYAMASDALIFKCLGNVSTKYHTPVVGTLLASFLTGIMAAIFNLKQLVNMMSIGTLMAYTIVAACVIILRHSDVNNFYDENDVTENLNLMPPKKNITMETIFKTVFNFTNKTPTYLTQKIVTVLVFIFSMLCLIFACLVSFLEPDLVEGQLYAVVPTGVLVILMLLVLISLYTQPKAKASLSFQVPLVPLVPALSICINIYLMLMLDGSTWIRFAIWMSVGLPIYFISCYLYYYQKQLTSNTNGCISNGRNTSETKQNGKLTIPAIIVDPPSSDVIFEEDEIEPETEENIISRERTLSVDSELTNAVLELDKVLNDSESDLLDDCEAINDDTISRTLEQVDISNLDPLDNKSIKSDSESINSASIHSKEYCIEAQIHSENQIIIPIPPPLPILVFKTTSPLQLKVPIGNLEDIKLKTIHQPEQTQTEHTNKVLDNTYQPIKLPEFNLAEVKLRTTPRLEPRPRTESIESEGPLDNVKTGSIQYNKIRNKLEHFLKNQKKLPPRYDVSWSDEKSTPNQKNDSQKQPQEVLEEINNKEDLPDDYGRSKEFREDLNNILLKKQPYKPKDVIPTEKIFTKQVPTFNNLKLRKTGLLNDENNENPEKDKEKHKRLMIATLRHIKLKRTGLNLNEENSENKDDVNKAIIDR